MALFSLNKSGKQVSVTVLRQVPIRFDEPSRSWLGGLPMLPDDVEWPRDNEGDPLHFVAQVACADFPKQLWDGLGPRKGWLLLFVETIKLEDWNEGNIVQVLHTEELGTEREPPEDHPTVRHTMSDYIDDARPNIRRGVLPGWRKWPVDMVVQAEVPTEEASANGTPSIAPEILYDAPVSEKSFMQQGATEDVFQTDRPFSWRGALYCVEQLLRDLEPKMRHSVHRQIAVSELPRIDTTKSSRRFRSPVSTGRVD